MRKGIVLFSTILCFILNSSYVFGSVEIKTEQDVATAADAVDRQDVIQSEELQLLQKLKELTADVPEENIEIEENNNDLATYDIPVVVNDRVAFFMEYYQDRSRKHFEKWLARSSKYLPMIKNTLKENEMPEDLAYLALIESGFSPYAYSRAKAVGLWQFIRGTGLKYGLKINAWVDERRDPEKATLSAVNYLKDLYAMFGSWNLAVASYNAGEGRIIRAINMHNTQDFWTISQKKYLKRETKDYVPKFLAAVLIAKEPEKYGFYNIEYEEPVEYAVVTVPGGTDLHAVAKASNSGIEEIRELNPELLRMFTPPDIKEYEIKIPLSGKDIFYDNFTRLPQSEKRNFITHEVKKGQTISTIARSYKVTSDSIIYLNGLNGRKKIRVGQEIVIPVLANSNSKKTGIKPVAAKTELKRLAKKEISYIVKKGDTITSIAREFGTTINAIKQWNGIDNIGKIFPGDKIRLFPSITRLNFPENAITR